MTSLQQTAMLGGSASAKVASYTLVAADAGTTVSMSNAGATTITVNTGLFSAGDIVTILNVGAGTCTITAGTATVSKATNATLALVTSAGGVLYFTATGAATFLPFDVGSAAASGGMTLLDSGTLTGASVTSATIVSGYVSLFVQIENCLPVNDDESLRMRYNGDTGTNYQFGALTDTSNQAFANNSLYISRGIDNAVSTGISVIRIYNYDSTTTFKANDVMALNTAGANTANFSARFSYGYYNQTTAITSLNFSMASGNLTSGTYKIYGVK
jgi:hypothetical protein